MGRLMKKISVTMAGNRKTSLSLEPEFHDFLVAYSKKSGKSFAKITAEAREKYPKGNLSSAMRRLALTLAIAASI